MINYLTPLFRLAGLEQSLAAAERDSPVVHLLCWLVPTRVLNSLRPLPHSPSEAIPPACANWHESQ